MHLADEKEDFEHKRKLHNSKKGKSRDGNFIFIFLKNTSQFKLSVHPWCLINSKNKLFQPKISHFILLSQHNK
jgi:hypothetical protein